MPQQAFLFDANRCTGCQACELACTIENELPATTSWRQVVTLNEARHAGVPVIHLSLACNHCEEPPCMAACPALAYSKDPDSGRVTLDAELCIGCKYCGWACPYDAPRFDAGSGVMTKCTFCGRRQERGLPPACVEQCPTGALGFGALASLPATDSAPGLPRPHPGRPDPRPAVRFVPWRPAAAVADAPPEDSDAGAIARPPSKIRLRSEWPLVGFTLLAALLVAALASSIAGASWPATTAFFGLAASSLALSTLHLGRKRRAWRAVLNLRRSWLSREIVLYSAFLGLAAARLLVFRDHPGLGAATVFVGFAALFAMDRVYDLVRPPALRPLHSADVLLTGALWTALFLGSLPAAALGATVKLVLYLVRKGRYLRSGRDARLGWSLVRVGSGFVFPLVMGLADPQRWPLWALAGTAIGELVDRCELYGELEVPTPRRQMASELERRLRPSVGSRGR